MNTKNNRYWFRAKRYGLGWGLPCAWQGWVFLITWLMALPFGHRFLAPNNRPLRWAFTAAMLLLLITVFYWKGEPSGRRWNDGHDA